jgi:CRISPR-associated protein Cas5h
MKGLSFELELLYFSSFRKPTSTSLILTYPIPPFTTIRGLVSNALGLPRDDLFLQEQIKIGIAVKKFGYKNVELAKILKLKETSGDRTVQFPSSPMFREFIVNPQYIIYIGGEDEIIMRIYESLRDPERPLYLGQSDDLVELNVNAPIDIQETESNIIWSAAKGIFSDAFVEKVPFKFLKNNGTYTVNYIIISVFKEYPYNSGKITRAYNFQSKSVVLV